MSARIVQQLREAFPFESAHRFLIFDRDAKYGLEVPIVVRWTYSESRRLRCLSLRNDVIQQVSSTAFDPTLGNAVLPGTFKRGPHRIRLQ
jgi:hypothetical protein